MCGICGERSFAGPVDAAVVRRMRDMLVHRGPDDAGLYAEGVIGLGHRRLSIIDLSPNGHQPMWSADRRLGIVFNGEIYNFREIRKSLESCGYAFVSNSDTEVVVNAVHCWGLEQAVSKFIGMFAFAIWDSRDRCLYLCRDRVGVKPLFYYFRGGVLLFASEMRALLVHPRMTRQLEPRGLAQFFMAGNTLGETTAFKNTYRLLPGHFLKLTADGALSTHCYWSLDHVERGCFRGSFEDAAERLTELCDSAFGYRLVSDVPVGLFLSGGTDSSLLAAFLSKRLGQELLHITIGFREPRVDEADKAASVAHQLGVRHVVEYLDVPSPNQVLGRFTEIYDEPFADTSGIPTALLSKVAREHVKVALSADGGDEQFCGYESYATYNRHYRLASYIPVVLRRALSWTLGRLVPYRLLLSAVVASRNGGFRNPQLAGRYEKWLEVLGAATPADLIRVTNEKAFRAIDASRLVHTSVAEALNRTVLWAPDLHVSPEAMVDGMMRTDYSAFLRDDILTKVDRASMAVSLECREPFLDHRLAEFAFSLPIEFVWDGHEHKRLLKHLLRRYVAEPQVAARKQGFSIPLYEWMRGPWKPWVMEWLAPSRLRAVGVLDERAAAREVDRFYRYQGGRAERVLVLLLFQMWAEKWYLSRAW